MPWAFLEAIPETVPRTVRPDASSTPQSSGELTRSGLYVPQGALQRALDTDDVYEDPPGDERGGMQVDMVEGGDSADIPYEQFDSSLRRDLQHQIPESNNEIMSIIESLVGSTSAYKRERTRGLRTLIVDVYPAERVAAAANFLPSMNSLKRVAFDLIGFDETGRRWDFEQEDMREKARKNVIEEKQGFLIASPA